jgi:DNA repair exonuclease SbcCD nuclease subunit
MISGQYARAWEIYEACQRELEKDPERLKRTQPIVYFALKEQAPRINALKAELKREQDRRAEVESEYTDTVRKLREALTTERRIGEDHREAREAHERRANTLEEQSRPPILKYDPGEREALMELGWRKAV